MSDYEEFDERVWAAERREFVADWRDGTAAEREADADVREETADEREQRADDREAELDELEQRLDVRAVELGLPPRGQQAERETPRLGVSKPPSFVTCMPGATEARPFCEPGGSRPRRGRHATGGSHPDYQVGAGLR